MSDNGLQTRVSLWQIAREMFFLGATGLGGSLQMRFHHVAVTKRRWIPEEDFSGILATASLSPGGNSTNVGLEIARHLRGVPGMLVAYTAMLLPGTVLITLLGGFYVYFDRSPYFKGFLSGMESAAAAMVFAVAFKLNWKQWSVWDWSAAVLATLGMVWAHLPLMAVVIGTGAYTYLLRRWSRR